MTAGEIFGCFFGTFIGGFLFYEGFSRLFLFYRLKGTGHYANGAVIRREKGKAFNTTVPHISFVDHEGNDVEGIAKNSIPSKDVHLHSVGDFVKIYYDPNNSSDFVIDAISNRFVCLFSANNFWLFGSVCSCNFFI